MLSYLEDFRLKQLVLINVVAELILTGMQHQLLHLVKALLDQPRQIRVYVLEVLEDESKAFYVIFKSSARAFNLSFFVFLRVAVDRF